MTTTTKWDDRAMDSALQEALDTDAPRSVANAVLSAPEGERRAAVERVNRASSSRPRFSLQILSMAALLIFGALIVFGVWFSERQDQENSAGERWQDPVKDPKRVTPKTVEELTKMLGQVTGISLRQQSMQLPIKPEPVVLDFDVGMEALYPVRDAGVRTKVLAEILRATKTPARFVRAKMMPGIRLVLHLKDGRNLHAVFEMGRTLRILDGTDFRLRDNALGKLVSDDCAEANYYSFAHIGVATVPSLLTQKMDGEPLFSRDRTTLRVLQCQMWEAMAHLDEFTKLRELRVSHSTGLDSRSFRRFGWPAKTRAVFSKLRSFGCPSARMDDSDLARLVGFMPELVELDLSTCPTIGMETMRAISLLPSLRRLDLSRSKGWKLADLAVLDDLPRDARVLLSRAGLSDDERKACDEAVSGRIIWADK